MARKPILSEEVKADAPKIKKGKGAVETELNAGSESPLTDEKKPKEVNQEYSSQCGGKLLVARTEQGLSTIDVAKQLRLSSIQIEALEQDNFSALPEPAIVKGFIRNYTKLLKIPSGPLIAAYTEMMPDKENYPFTLKPSIVMQITESKKSNKTNYILLVTGLLLGVAVWFFYQNYVQKPSPANPTSEIVEVLPEIALPMSERRENLTTTQVEMPEPPAAQAAAEPNTEQGFVSGTQLNEELVQAEPASTLLEEAKTNEEVTAQPEEAIADTAPVAEKTRLEFSATQETWLSVVNASGVEVYNKILYAGSRDVIDIRHPAEIIVGNAHGATLVVDGKSVDLAPYSRFNVARVRLNQ